MGGGRFAHVRSLRTLVQLPVLPLGAATGSGDRGRTCAEWYANPARGRATGKAWQVSALFALLQCRDQRLPPYMTKVGGIVTSDSDWTMLRPSHCSAFWPLRSRYTFVGYGFVCHSVGKQWHGCDA